MLISCVPLLKLNNMRAILINENEVREINPNGNKPKEHNYAYGYKYTEAMNNWNAAERNLQTYKTDVKYPVELVDRAVDVELIPVDAPKSVDKRLNPHTHINTQYIAKILGHNGLCGGIGGVNTIDILSAWDDSSEKMTGKYLTSIDALKPIVKSVEKELLRLDEVTITTDYDKLSIEMSGKTMRIELYKSIVDLDPEKLYNTLYKIISHIDKYRAENPQ